MLFKSHSPSRTQTSLQFPHSSEGRSRKLSAPNASPFFFLHPWRLQRSWAHVKDERCRLVWLIPNTGHSLNSPRPPFAWPASPAGRSLLAVFAQQTASSLLARDDWRIKIIEASAPGATPRGIVGNLPCSSPKMDKLPLASLHRLEYVHKC